MGYSEDKQRMPDACSTTSINPSRGPRPFAIVQLFNCSGRRLRLSGPQDSRFYAEGSLGYPLPALEHICCHILGPSVSPFEL